MTDDPGFEDHLAGLAAAFENGEKAALLEMMFHCATSNQPLPEWARNAFMQGYCVVREGYAPSWDDLFGKPHPGKKHLRTIQLDGQKWSVHSRVLDIRERENAPIDGALFERVGRELGIGGKTLVSKLYYSVDHALRRFRQR
jgi:hypothetical protein